MSQHYTEADLLETYYTRPGQSMPVMMHLADCGECASRYERLERKLRSLDACQTEQPEPFWARQRASVMQRIQRRRSPMPRLAAAAALVLALGGIAAWQTTLDKQTPSPKKTAVVETQSTVDETDPWQSDALKDYQPMVAWESWVPTTGTTGDQSL